METSFTKWWPKIVLAVLLIFSSVIYLWGLSHNPPSLNWDETSLGYNAFSILKTGHDEWGKFMPLTFRAFGDYKLPGYVYATVSSIAVFGLNAFGVRFPSAFFGVVTVLFTYLILRRLLYSVMQNEARRTEASLEVGESIEPKDPSLRSVPFWMTKSGTAELIALFGAFLVAISPWHFFVSRSALEANMALGLIAIAVYCFIRGIQGKSWWLLLATFCLGIAMFTYNSARVFAPIFLVGSFVIYWKPLWQKKTWAVISLTIFGIFTAAVFVFAVTDSSARYNDITILDQGAINRINEARGASSLPSSVSRLVHNKITYFVETAAQNYVHYFSPDYLFVKGGTQYQFSQPNFELLYIIDLPLALAGLWWFWRTKNRWGLVIGLWLLAAPIPAAITRETPHVLRSLFMFLPIELLSAFGLLEITTQLRRKSKELVVGFCLFLLAVAAIQAFFSYRSYIVNYPVQYACTWQYGYEQVVDYVAAHQQEYDQIIFTKKYAEPHIFWLFYTKENPTAYNNDPQLIRYKQSNWYWVDRIQNIHFVNDWEVQQVTKQLLDQNAGKILVVTSPWNYPRTTTPFTQILFPNGQPVFQLLQVDSKQLKLKADDITPPPPERGCYGAG